jgi:CDP-glycerol glycerophosphotransferase
VRNTVLKRNIASYNKIKSNTKTDDKVIMFSTFDGRGYSDSPKAIYLKMLGDESFKDYTFVWAFKKPKKFKSVLKNERTYSVQVGTTDYLETCATAKYWIVNYKIGDSIYPKDDQVYVQLWHGTPLKRLGYDIKVSDNAMNSIQEIRAKYSADAKKFTYLLAPSDFAREKFASAWNLKQTGQEGKIIVEGYPRNDYLINYKQSAVEKTKARLKLPSDKKVILYAPTWRDNQHDSKLGYVYKPDIDFDTLREKFGDEYVIAFRAHYLVANNFDFAKYDGFVYDVSKVTDINDLYIVSDMLITDYSSVFFDYANLKRPIIFYMYDIDDYACDIRGFYIETQELPGPITTTTSELVVAITNCTNGEFQPDEKYIKFNAKFNYLDDGNASERVINRIFGK